jgi:hypothetical protein
MAFWTDTQGMIHRSFTIGDVYIVQLITHSSSNMQNVPHGKLSCLSWLKV